MIPKRLSTYNVCRRLFCVAKLIAMAETVEKVAKRHFFEFCGFRLSHSLMGGEIRKARKPPGFHPF